MLIPPEARQLGQLISEDHFMIGSLNGAFLFFFKKIKKNIVITKRPHRGGQEGLQNQKRRKMINPSTENSPPIPMTVVEIP